MNTILPKNHYIRLRQRGVTGISRHIMLILRIEAFRAYLSQDESRAKDIVSRIKTVMMFQKEANLRAGMPFNDITQNYPSHTEILNFNAEQRTAMIHFVNKLQN